MTTSTMNRPMAKTKTNTLFDQQDRITVGKDSATVNMVASEKLSAECVGIRLTFSWYKTSKQVDKTAKESMAAAADSGEDAFSASKRLMDSKHPVIKEANELKRRIEGYWKSITVPLAAFAAGEGKPEPGVRLINKSHVEEFDSRMTSFQPEVKVMEARVNTNLEDIKRMDKDRLKGLYKEEDYPRNVSLDFSWGFMTVEVPRALEQLAPEIYQREMAKLSQRMDETFELANVGLLQQFLAVVESWVESLGPITRIYPKEEHPLSNYHNAEIRERQTHEQAPDDVPEGKTRIRVRHYPNGAKKMVEEWLGPFTNVEYVNLQPSQVANERRVFQTSTIEGMTQFLSQFRNVSGTAQTSDAVNAMVQEVERHLAQCSTAKEAAEELKNSNVFRAKTHQLVTQLSDRVKTEIEVFKQQRRKVKTNIVS